MGKQFDTPQREWHFCDDMVAKWHSEFKSPICRHDNAFLLAADDAGDADILNRPVTLALQASLLLLGTRLAYAALTLGAKDLHRSWYKF